MPERTPEKVKKVKHRQDVIGDLKALLPKLEGLSADVLTFGTATLDRHLPAGGLALGALHEIVPETAYDLAASFGFLTAVLSRLPRRGPIFFVFRSSAFDGCGRPYGRGLNALGLDPANVVLVEPRDDRQSLWAMEEALRSRVPVAVVGIVGKDIDLKSSQKLQRAARLSALPLFLLKPSTATEASAATTRWRVSSVKAVRDRFGVAAYWRWRTRLERCRNGNSAEWLLEWDHDARCFSMASALADPALFDGAETQSVARAG